MRSSSLVIVLVVPTLFSCPNLILAKPPSVTATCNISCIVDDVVEWSDISFPSIELAKLTNQNDGAFESSSLILYTNGDVQITADNSDTAQLSKDRLHKLITEYKLEYDGLGVSRTGGSPTKWSSYDCFLSKGSTVTHVRGDGVVEVTLSVRTRKEEGEFVESGRYSATQTLTVCWQS